MTAYYYGEKPNMTDEEFSLLKEELIWNGSKVRLWGVGVGVSRVCGARWIAWQEGGSGTTMHLESYGMPFGALCVLCLPDPRRGGEGLVPVLRPSLQTLHCRPGHCCAAALPPANRWPSWMVMSSASWRPPWPTLRASPS